MLTLQVKSALTGDFLAGVGDMKAEEWNLIVNMFSLGEE